MSRQRAITRSSDRRPGRQDKRAAMPRRHSGSPGLIFFAVAATITAVSIGAGRASALPWLAAYLAGVNLATFALYAYDKRVAGGGRLRVPEAVLHGLALLGGTPAAVLGQRLLRHKTVKASFRRVGWAIIVVQLALVGSGLWYWWGGSRG
jgi:uncharacterized membrane protein YsdA (DUF1294 family)